jgi:hypothetical protein
MTRRTTFTFDKWEIVDYNERYSANTIKYIYYDGVKVGWICKEDRYGRSNWYAIHDDPEIQRQINTFRLTYHSVMEHRHHLRQVESNKRDEQKRDQELSQARAALGI